MKTDKQAVATEPRDLGSQSPVTILKKTGV